MKLYRHHSLEFQNMISNNPLFVADTSRKFNHTGKIKNEAELHFYSDSQKGAENYSTDSTQLFEYNASGLNILDLRIKENRSQLTNVIASLIAEENATKENMRKHVPVKFLDELANKETTVECVVNDKVVSGSTFWGQRATDFSNGVAMRKDLESLGYDGIIFQDYQNVEVALLKAKVWNG